ncbi:MAG: hypothetical protein JW914_00110 [Syntrophaceae bacterium]|nr:hypothetical protein [Syntrophaceae bacterium]
MARAKKGDVLYCEVCGLTAIVEEECGCANLGVLCCEEPMINKGPAPPKKKPAAKKAKTPKKKTVKKAAKKPASKKVAKKKPAKKKKR